MNNSSTANVFLRLTGHDSGIDDSIAKQTFGTIKNAPMHTKRVHNIREVSKSSWRWFHVIRFANLLYHSFLQTLFWVDSWIINLSSVNWWSPPEFNANWATISAHRNGVSTSVVAQNGRFLCQTFRTNKIVDKFVIADSRCTKQEENCHTTTKHVCLIHDNILLALIWHFQLSSILKCCY